jgi:hypothetical protein
MEVTNLKRWIWLFMLALLVLVPLAGCGGAPSSKSTPSTPAAPVPSVTQTTQLLSLKVTEPADESVVKTGSVSLSGTVSNSAEITVNGTSVAVENGNFNAVVELEEGPNSLEVRAADGKGHEEIKVITIVYLP